jgi:hypothetical protein
MQVSNYALSCKTNLSTYESEPSSESADEPSPVSFEEQPIRDILLQCGCLIQCAGLINHIITILVCCTHEFINFILKYRTLDHQQTFRMESTTTTHAKGSTTPTAHSTRQVISSFFSSEGIVELSYLVAPRMTGCIIKDTCDANVIDSLKQTIKVRSCPVIKQPVVVIMKKKPRCLLNEASAPSID